VSRGGGRERKGREVGRGGGTRRKGGGSKGGEGDNRKAGEKRGNYCGEGESVRGVVPWVGGRRK